MRARTAALLLSGLLIAGSAGAMSFLTQKELVGHEGDTVIVLPPYTYVTVVQRFGEHAVINYRVGDTVHELRVSQDDLDAARPDEIDTAPISDPEKLAAFYRERMPFDVYIDEFPAAVTDKSSEQAPGAPSYRIRVKTCSLAPEAVSNIRFEVHVYFDHGERERDNALWQLRILSTKPREFKTVETPPFSIESLHAASATGAATSAAAGAAERAPATNEKTPGNATTESPAETSATEAEKEPGPPTMRYSVRLFVDELFVAQQSGVVKRIDEETDEDLWNAAYGPRRLRLQPQGQRGQ